MAYLKFKRFRHNGESRVLRAGGHSNKWEIYGCQQHLAKRASESGNGVV